MNDIMIRERRMHGLTRQILYANLPHRLRDKSIAELAERKGIDRRSAL